MACSRCSLQLFRGESILFLASRRYPLNFYLSDYVTDAVELKGVISKEVVGNSWGTLNAILGYK